LDATYYQVTVSCGKMKLKIFGQKCDAMESLLIFTPSEINKKHEKNSTGALPCFVVTFFVCKKA